MEVKAKVLISGGSGLVGSRLTNLLLAKGYEVAHLSRSAHSKQAVPVIQWDVRQQQLDAQAIQDFDHIIHLAGAGVADKPWTAARKQEIYDSRVKSTALLHKAISKNDRKPKTFISASAIGFYGFQSSEHIFTEDNPAGDDFLAKTCEDWEEEVWKFDALGVKSASVRIGLVLSKEGGALEKMIPPVKWGVGAALGSGKQYVPWIHVDDLCRQFIFIMEKQLQGPFNGVANSDISNRDFMHALAKALHRRIWLPPAPGFVLRLMMGERAIMVLEGFRLSNEKIKKAGFQFEFQALDAALKDLL